MTVTAARIVTPAVASYPGVEARILGSGTGRESLDAYLAAGGYAPVEDAEELLKAVDRAGIRGRGGAAFPLATKIRAVRAGTDPVAVANGEEGEPASVKDRWLLRHRPHLVLDGLRLAAALAGAGEVHAYVSDGESAESLEQAKRELAGRGIRAADVRITVVDPTYVAGEESALVRAVNGGPALPTEKPPRPFEAGIGGRPTLVSNVETLANLPLVQRLGGDGYRRAGTVGSPGTFLLTLTGTPAGGLYEVPFGTTLREVLVWRDADTDGVSAFLMGGYFAGLVGSSALDVPLEYDAVRALGSGLGCGAIAVVSREQCPVAVVAAVLGYFARENAGQCGSCFNGTAAMAAVVQGLAEHRAEPADVERLVHWSGFLRGRGACGTLDGATSVAASLLREFPGLVQQHVEAECRTCLDGPAGSDPPYAVFPPSAA